MSRHTAQPAFATQVRSHSQQPKALSLFAIHRLPDLCGWIEIGPTWLEIQHRFGDRSFSTVDYCTMRTPAGHLKQVCATEDVHGRLTAHRRVIARLVRLGYRPRRLDDEQVIAIVLGQAESTYRRMATAGWRDALISTYWEERAYQGRIGCTSLADRRRFERTLRGWLAE